MTENNSQLQLKNFNRRSVLNYIRRNGFATKAELAAVTGLTFMAIKKILGELEELNLIRFDKMESGGVGRHALTYTINENYGYAIGVHINIFATSASILDLHGNILAIEHYDMQNLDATQSAMIDLIVGLIERVIKKSGIDEKKILGIGIGTPGPVDLKTGIVLTPPNLPVLRYLPLKKILEQRLGYKVYVQKDTNALAMGEYWRGAGTGYNNMIYVDMDMGIGCSVIMNGEINNGANFVAGEFGHITIDVNGPQCNCGNKGCLETLSSGISIMREFSGELRRNPQHPLYEKRDGLVIDDIFDAVDNNDLTAISIINQAAFYAGIAISNLINILDPDIIIIGGILVRKCRTYYEVVKNVAVMHCLKEARRTLLVESELKNEAGVVGAGEIVADNFFNDIVNEVLSKK